MYNRRELTKKFLPHVCPRRNPVGNLFHDPAQVDSDPLFGSCRVIVIKNVGNVYVD